MYTAGAAKTTFPRWSVGTIKSLCLGGAGLLADLEALGLIERLLDRRIQIPDVYWNGFGRRDGVKPLK